MPAGVESALLWMSVAKSSLSGGNKAHALEALNEALIAARKAEETFRPHLILAVAGQLARAEADATYAQQILLEAVNDFNAQSSYAPPKWQREIKAGGLTLSFQLNGVEIGRGFADSLPVFAANNLEGTVSITGRLIKEEHLAAAMIAIADSIMNYR